MSSPVDFKTFFLSLVFNSLIGICLSMGGFFGFFFFLYFLFVGEYFSEVLENLQPFSLQILIFPSLSLSLTFSQLLDL